MANPISKNIKTGTVGELLVQLRLLQYDVQSAPPLKDSGNDLIAVKGNIFKAIQIKTSTGDRFNLQNLDRIYHILALVHLVGEEDNISLDSSKIFLLSKEEVTNMSYNVDTLTDKE
jgi:hypothetical protein